MKMPWDSIRKPVMPPSQRLVCVPGIYHIKLKSHPSVCLSIRILLLELYMEVFYIRKCVVACLYKRLPSVSMFTIYIVVT